MALQNQGLAYGKHKLTWVVIKEVMFNRTIVRWSFVWELEQFGNVRFLCGASDLQHVNQFSVEHVFAFNRPIF